MTTDDDKQKYQQQIMFSEGDTTQDSGFKDPAFKRGDFTEQQQPQVILPEAAWQEVDDAFNEQPKYDTPSRPRWLWRITGFSLAAVLGYELIEFFISGFNSSPVITALYGVLFAAISTISGLVLFKELRGLRHFKRQHKTQQQGKQLLNNEITLDSSEFCQKISTNLSLDTIAEQQQLWQDAISPELSEQEILTLYSQLVLNKVDEQALSQIAKFSTEAVVLVAVSPVAIIDMLVIMWRNLRMIDKIAGLYGIRLGYWSRISLIKQVFMNMVYAGASEIIADIGLEALGVETLGKLSTRMAQGLGAGMLTTRLGIKTLNLCRPLPFTDTPPGIKQVRQEVLSQVKALLINRK